MNILVVVATKFELDIFLKKYNFIFQNEIYSTQIKENRVDCIVTGIGMVATTYAITKQLQNCSYSIIMNVGIAGSFTSKFPIGSVVEVKTEQFADLGVDDNGMFQSVFDSQFVSANEFPYQNKKLINTTDFDFLKVIQKANGITVNTVSGSQSRIDALVQKYQPDTESMEGAAVFYVSLQSKIPFFQIRAISNMVEPRNKKNWNISFAITNLNSTLIDIFESF